jgi:hypothetical protein
MTLRRLALLALAALLATGGAFWLSSQRHLERAARAGDPLLPQLRGALNDVSEIRIARGDGSGVTLQRAADGWTVFERRYRADAGNVRKLLLDLAALEIVEEKTHDPQRYAVLGVEDVASPSATGTRIDVKKGSGAIQSVILGKTSGSREGYVRVAGAEPTFLAQPQVVAESNPARWLDTTLLDVPAERIRAVTLPTAGQAPRNLEGPALAPTLAGALQTLTLEDLHPRPLEVAGREAAAAIQQARFVTWDGLVIEVRGRQEGARHWVAFAAKFNPAEARQRPPGLASASSSPAPQEPAVGVDVAAEAGLLERRFAEREFEIPAYRYSTLFDQNVAGTAGADLQGPAPALSLP